MVVYELRYIYSDCVHAGESQVVDYVDELKRKNIKLFISALVEAELTSSKDLSDSDIQKLYNFVSDYFIVIPVDRYTLETASAIRRKYPKIKMADACVLGVSKMYNLELITRDKELLKIKEFNSFLI